MAKKSSKVYFRYLDNFVSVKDIYKHSRKRCGRAKWRLSVQAEAVKDGVSIPVRLVYVVNRNNHSDYLVLVSTDMSLNEEEIIQTYGKRWDIEVFFKVCKSYLKLTSECHSISYDAMTAHVAVVFTRYMMLAVEHRKNCDERTIGELFYLSVDELEDLRFTEAMALLLMQFAEKLECITGISDLYLTDIVSKFIKGIPEIMTPILRKRA